MAVKRYLMNQLVWIDIAVNATFGGSPYMTISERAWNHQWLKTIAVIDWIFRLFGQADHCKNAAEGDESQYEIQ
jgi:hypothetical protein